MHGLMNARQTSAPASTISLFRLNPAVRPYSFQSASCRSTSMKLTTPNSSAHASAPVGQWPWTIVQPWVSQSTGKPCESVPMTAFSEMYRTSSREMVRYSDQSREPVTRTRRCRCSTSCSSIWLRCQSLRVVRNTDELDVLALRVERGLQVHEQVRHPLGDVLVVVELDTAV